MSTQVDADGVITGELVAADEPVNQSLQQLTKAEIDQQVATAHAYPRSIAKFQKRAMEMVTLDEDTAQSCLYSRPVGGGKFAEGMSIRMAEIVGNCYGNLRVSAQLVEMTPRYVKARGYAHDLETNFASASEVIESTVGKDGRPYSERQRIVVAKAAMAKARRDATFSVVPKALCSRLEIEARRVAVGDATTLEKRRNQVMAWIKSLSIDPARVFAALDVKGEADIGIDQLTTLTGIKTAIKDGEVTIDEAFPSLQTGPILTRTEAAKEALRRGATASATPKADASAAIPHYDKATALAAVKAVSTLEELEKLWADIRKDFQSTNRELPLEAEAAVNDRMETLAAS